MKRVVDTHTWTSRIATVLAGGLLVGAGMFAVPSSAQADVHPVLFGAYNRVWAGQLGAANVSQWEPRVQAMQSWLGRPAAIHHVLANGQSAPADVLATLQAVWRDNNVPMLSYYPRSSVSSINGATTGNTSIAIGLQDATIQPLVDAIKQFLCGPDGVYGTGDDRRIFLRLAPEANGDWSGYSPNTLYGSNQHPSDSVYAQNVSSFKAMWIHIHTLFTNAGIDATRLQFVFGVSIPDSYRANNSHITEDIYPGDAYVDWVSMDGYNRGTTMPSGWRTPDQVFSAMLARLRAIAPTKPVAISEVGAVSSGTATLTDKNDWITSLCTWLTGGGSAIRMVVWWNQDDTTDLNFAAFGAGFGDTVFSTATGSYRAFSGLRTAVTSNSWLQGPTLSNPRLLTDAQFTGV